MKTREEIEEKLKGKVVESISFPESLDINEDTSHDDNVVIVFTDGTKLKLASWDYEGYRSGMYKEVEQALNSNNT